MGYYSVVKKDKIIKISGKWVELETVILSEVTQTLEDNSAYFLLYTDARF